MPVTHAASCAPSVRPWNAPSKVTTTALSRPCADARLREILIAASTASAPVVKSTLCGKPVSSASERTTRARTAVGNMYACNNPCRACEITAFTTLSGLCPALAVRIPLVQSSHDRPLRSNTRFPLARCQTTGNWVCTAAGSCCRNVRITHVSSSSTPRFGSPA